MAQKGQFPISDAEGKAARSIGWVEERGGGGGGRGRARGEGVVQRWRHRALVCHDGQGMHALQVLSSPLHSPQAGQVLIPAGRTAGHQECTGYLAVRAPLA